MRWLRRHISAKDLSFVAMLGFLTWTTAQENGWWWAIGMTVGGLVAAAILFVLFMKFYINRGEK